MMPIHVACSADVRLDPALRAAHACLAMGGVMKNGAYDCILGDINVEGIRLNGFEREVASALFKEYGSDVRVAGTCGVMMQGK